MKKCINMLHIMFRYAKVEAIAYLNVDILLSIVSASQLLILQMIVDGFAKNEDIFSAGGIGLALLCSYFFAKNLLDNLKAQTAFRLEKSISINLGTEIAETVNSLDYDCYENENMYDVIEKVSDKPYQHFIKAFFSFSNQFSSLLLVFLLFWVYRLVHQLVLLFAHSHLVLVFHLPNPDKHLRLQILDHTY